MPRLIGKPSTAPTYIGLAFLVAIVGASALESTGDVNLVPGFGDRNLGSQRPPSFSDTQRYPVQP